MTIKIEFGIKEEIQRIKNSFKKLEWYNKNGYRLKFPEGTNQHKSSIKEVIKASKKEYDEKQYKLIADNLIKNYSSLELKFFNKMNLPALKDGVSVRTKPQVWSDVRKSSHLGFAQCSVEWFQQLHCQQICKTCQQTRNGFFASKCF